MQEFKVKGICDKSDNVNGAEYFFFLRQHFIINYINFIIIYFGYIVSISSKWQCMNILHWYYFTWQNEL